DAQLQMIKSFAAMACTDDHTGVLADLLEGSVTLPGLEVDTDLRWELLTAAAGLGAVGEAEISAELQRDATAAGQRAAATARAAVPDPQAKERVWADALAPGALPNAVQRAVIAGFARSRDRSLLAPFAPRYFDAIEQVWQTHTHEM